MTATILVLIYLLTQSYKELELEKDSPKCEKQSNLVNGNRNIGFGTNTEEIARNRDIAFDTIVCGNSKLTSTQKFKFKIIGTGEQVVRSGCSGIYQEGK